jgi:elongation factor P
MVVATQIKRGNVLKLDGELFKILKLTHVTPGKGNAVVQTDLRSLSSGVKTEKRFRSSEDVEIAYIDTRTMQFLYIDGDRYHFMDGESFEQFEISKELLGDDTAFLVPNENFAVDIYEGAPVGITLPDNVILTIEKTDPPQKGSGGKTKPATTNTGLDVKVPLFLAEGEGIVVRTVDGSYLERAKSD